MDEQKPVPPTPIPGSPIPQSAPDQPIRPAGKAVLNASQIYPNPDQTDHTPADPTHPSATSQQQTNGVNGTETKKTGLILVMVTGLGAFIAIPALLGLIGAAKIISFGFVSGTSVFITTVDVLYLALGLGLIFRKELARVIYVFLAVISLCLSVYGTIHLASQEHSQPTQSANLRIQLQYDESYCLTQPPSQQRSEIVQELNNDINANQKPSRTCSNGPGIRGNQYIKLIPAYSLALLPLVFLTRPRVKTVFS